MFLPNSTSKLNVVTKDTNAIGDLSKLKSANKSDHTSGFCGRSLISMIIQCLQHDHDNV